LSVDHPSKSLDNQQMKKLYHWLVGFRGTRATYWSHSKLANKIREWLGVEKPPVAATAAGWRQYRQRNKEKFGYWLTEEVFDFCQDLAYFPHDVYRNARRYFLNRFIDKPWCLNTKLPKGDWYEMETRLLHGLFGALVDFVEEEKANMQYLTDEWKEDEDGQVKRATVKRVFPSREKGLQYLDWEISLGEESPGQSEAAKEVKELYLWWKDVRPARPDPYDVSGWSEYCDQRRDKDGLWGFFDKDDETDEERADARRRLDALHSVEEQYDTEDEEMMIRLIKIRKGMWT
jgi:hypothetical protein